MADAGEQSPQPAQQSLGRQARPFDDTNAAHTVVRAAEALGWDLSDSAAFLRRVQHVEYGLSAEIEFAALLRWLRTCVLVHRLSEDALSDPAWSARQISDLFAVFSAEGRTVSTLIEVKTTERPVLTFTKDYMSRLSGYASLLNQPLLIAWRPRMVGFWLLVDPTHARSVGGDKYEIDLETAAKNDLMSWLAGDFFLVPEQRAGLRFEAKRVSEKRPARDGYEAVFHIENAYIQDAAGNEVADVPDSIVWTIVSAIEEHQDVTDEGFVRSFLASGGMTRAQMVLRTAVGFPLKEDQRIHWKSVGTNLDAVLSSDALLADAKARFGTFVRYIFHQRPQAIPQFLPRGWRPRRE